MNLYAKLCARAAQGRPLVGESVPANSARCILRRCRKRLVSVWFGIAGLVNARSNLHAAAGRRACYAAGPRRGAPVRRDARER